MTMKRILFLLVAFFSVCTVNAQTESEAFNSLIEAIPAINESLKEETKGSDLTCFMSYDEANKALIYNITVDDKNTFNLLVLKKGKLARKAILETMSEWKNAEILEPILDDYEKYGFKFVYRLLYYLSNGNARYAESEVSGKEARKIAKKAGLIY